VKFKLLILLVLVLAPLFFLPQNPKMDSLRGVLKTTKSDSAKARILFDIALQYRQLDNFSKALETSNEGLRLSRKSGYTALEGDFHNFNGVIHYEKSEMDTALYFFFKAVKIKEALRDTQNLSHVYNNVGTILLGKGIVDKAMSYFEKALEFSERTGNKKVIAEAYNNMGNVSYYRDDNDKALAYYLKYLEMSSGTEDKTDIATAYYNTAIIYFYKDNYPKALNACSLAIQIREEIKDKPGLMEAYNVLSYIFLEQGKAAEARRLCLKALTIPRESELKFQVSEAYLTLAECDSTLGNFKEAYVHLKRSLEIKNEFNSEESNKTIAVMQARYEDEKKELHIRDLEKNEQIQQLEIEKKNSDLAFQKTLIGSAVIILVVIIGLLFSMYRNFKSKKKANEALQHAFNTIEEKNRLVEEKQKEILDSIHYAGRIQTALITNEKYIEKTLNRLNK